MVVDIAVVRSCPQVNSGVRGTASVLDAPQSRAIPSPVQPCSCSTKSSGGYHSTCPPGTASSHLCCIYRSSSHPISKSQFQTLIPLNSSQAFNKVCHSTADAGNRAFNDGGVARNDPALSYYTPTTHVLRAVFSILFSKLWVSASGLSTCCPTATCSCCFSASTHLSVADLG